MLIQLDRGWTLDFQPDKAVLTSPVTKNGGHDPHEFRTIQAIMGWRFRVKGIGLDGQEKTVYLVCDHVEIIERNESAVCKACGDNLGWYCPDSPNHLCDYDQGDETYNPDHCRYCGQPDERK